MVWLGASSLKVLPFQFTVAVIAVVIATCEVSANPGMATNLGLQANIRSDREVRGPFVVPVALRERVDFWKDIFTRYGTAHSVIHHRDFPQIIFGVIDLSREFQAMSKGAFDAYKGDVVKKTLDDVKRQLLDLANGATPSTSFQERALEQLSARQLPRSILRAWVEQDLIRTQTGIRERYAEAIKRSWRYLPVMEQIFVQEFGLPKELTRIPFIESSFDYTAYSSVGAAGIWQFMPRTARAHRMLVGRYVDERRDPLKATRAAAEYLRSAYNSLGSWPLAITSYNHGVGGVRQKVRKAGTDDLIRIIEDPNERFFGFASTNFYPEFLAAVEIFDDHQRYFPEIPEESPLRVVSYPLRKPISAGAVASRLGIRTEELKEANYGLLDPVWKGRAAIPSGYTLRIPISLKERADRIFGGTRVDQLPVTAKPAQVIPVAAQVTGALHVVKRGETISAIARKYGVGVQDIVELNNLSSLQVKSGQQLRVNRGSVSTGKTGGVKAKPVRYVTVRAGDTLGSIAGREKISTEHLKRINGIRGSTIRMGQRLRVP